MTSIKQWAFSVCVAMLACGIARLLIPKGNMQKVFSVTISAFLLCGILSPFLLQRPELRLDIRQQSIDDVERRAQRLTETIDRQSETVVAFQLEKITAEKLREMGINYHSITIHMNQNGQSDSSLGEVEIVVAEEHKEEAAAIRRELNRELGLSFRVHTATSGGAEDEMEPDV